MPKKRDKKEKTTEEQQLEKEIEKEIDLDIDPDPGLIAPEFSGVITHDAFRLKSEFEADHVVIHTEPASCGSWPFNLQCMAQTEILKDGEVPAGIHIAMCDNCCALFIKDDNARTLHVCHLLRIGHMSRQPLKAGLPAAHVKFALGDALWEQKKDVIDGGCRKREYKTPGATVFGSDTVLKKYKGEDAWKNFNTVLITDEVLIGVKAGIDCIGAVLSKAERERVSALRYDCFE